LQFFYISSFLLFTAAAFILSRTSPVSVFRSIRGQVQPHLRPNRKISLAKKIRRSTGKKKISGIRRIFLDAEHVLEMTHRTDRMNQYTAASAALFFAGVLISALLRNYFLMPVLAVGMALLPWLAVLLSAASFQRQLTEELETTLSMVTTAYLRSDNIIGAIQENIDNIHYPIRDIFEKFLVQANMVSPDIPKLLGEMKDSLDSPVFHDWVDQLILCMGNRTLKSTLQPIVSRLAVVRDVSGKLGNLMYEPVKEFIEMASLLILNFPLLNWVYPEWYQILMYTPAGQAIVALTFLVIFISFVAVIRKTRPAEYREGG